MSWSVACVERDDENLRDLISSWWAVGGYAVGEPRTGKSLTRVYAEIHCQSAHR